MELVKKEAIQNTSADEEETFEKFYVMMQEIINSSSGKCPNIYNLACKILDDLDELETYIER